MVVLVALQVKVVLPPMTTQVQTIRVVMYLTLAITYPTIVVKDLELLLDLKLLKN